MPAVKPKRKTNQSTANTRKRAQTMLEQTHKKNSHLQILDAKKHIEFLREQAIAEANQKLSQQISKINQNPKLSSQQKNARIVKLVNAAGQRKKQIKKTAIPLTETPFKESIRESIKSHMRFWKKQPKKGIKQIKKYTWLTPKDKMFLLKQTRQGHTFTAKHLQKLKKIREQIQYSENIPLETLDAIERYILPKIPEPRLGLFFQHALSKILKYKPISQHLEIIGKHMLPKIPEKELGLFLTVSLPAMLEHKPTTQQWNTTVHKIMPKIPKNQLSNFFRFALPESLKHKPTPTQLRQTWSAITTHILPKIPEKQLDRFFQSALSATLKHNPAPQQLQMIGEHMLPKIPKEKLNNFFADALPELLKTKPTLQTLQSIGQHMLGF